ncbi:MAG: hypothetical protein QW470_02290 [Candidatus Caldarchaeum sp.]
MHRARLVAAAVAVVLAAVIAAVLFPAAPEPTAPTQTPTTTTTQTQTRSNIVSLTLYLNDYGYNASYAGPKITVYVGDLVRIRLLGNGSGPVVHDFTLDEKSPSPYNVKSDRLRKGQEQLIEFVANVPGVYEYYCSVTSFAGPSHRDRGQKGVIEIIPRG